MRRTITTFILGAAALLAAAAPAAEAQRGREEYATEIDTTVPFARGGTVELQLTGGEIIVTGWSREQVRVRASSERSALRLDASASHLSLGLRPGTRRSGDTRFEVTVPVGTRVKANTSSGDIRISGSKGEVEARTQRGDVVVEDAASRVEISALNGDVEVAGVAGDLHVGNVLSGDVRVRGVTGEIDVKTVSGEIDLRDVRSRLVRVSSTSGDITFEGTIDATGRYELQAHSGDIDLMLPANAGAQLKLSTYSGGVESDFPLTLLPGQHGLTNTRGKEMEFRLGGGGARITAASFSGDINIRSRGGTGGRGDSDR
jgi:DUF4097 and DUF4098 domain-containing protein YvlB